MYVGNKQQRINRSNNYAVFLFASLNDVFSKTISHVSNDRNDRMCYSNSLLIFRRKSLETIMANKVINMTKGNEREVCKKLPCHNKPT